VWRVDFGVVHGVVINMAEEAGESPCQVLPECETFPSKLNQVLVNFLLPPDRSPSLLVSPRHLEILSSKMQARVATRERHVQLNKYVPIEVPPQPP